MKHGGTGTGYSNSNYGCRCDECTRANRERYARRTAERTATPKDPNDPRHGTLGFYNNHGCRCEPCTAVKALANAKHHAEHRKP